MTDTGERIERGKRLADLRADQDLTVVALAEKLNSVARALRLPPRWTGPKVSKIEVGSQNLVIADVACLTAYDPKERSWFWWYFGREMPAIRNTQPAHDPRPKPRSVGRAS